MKVLQAGTELLHADGRTHRYASLLSNTCCKSYSDATESREFNNQFSLFHLHVTNAACRRPNKKWPTIKRKQHTSTANWSLTQLHTQLAEHSEIALRVAFADLLSYPKSYHLKKKSTVRKKTESLCVSCVPHTSGLKVGFAGKFRR